MEPKEESSVFTNLSIQLYCTDYLYQYTLDLWTVCQIFAINIAPNIHYTLCMWNGIVSLLIPPQMTMSSF